MKFGYARVSTSEQNLDLQLDALKTEGCAKILREKVSSRRTERPELEALWAQLREGDEVVVYKLDRIARSTKELLELVLVSNVTSPPVSMKAAIIDVDLTPLGINPPLPSLGPLSLWQICGENYGGISLEIFNSMYIKNFAGL